MKSRSKRIRCKGCGKQFTTRVATAKTCSDTCRQRLRRKKVAKERAKEASVSTCSGYHGFTCPSKKETRSERCRDCKRKHDRLMKFFNTSFGARLKWELYERMTSVEQIKGIQGLEDYYQCHKLVRNANPIKSGKSESAFHVAHKVAVKDAEGRLGLYTRDNLIVVPAKVNQSMKNSPVYIHAEHGVHYLLHKELNDQFKLKGVDSDEDLRRLLIEHLGHDFIMWIDEKNLARRSKKNTNLNYEGKTIAAVAEVQATSKERQYLLGETDRLIPRDELPKQANAEICSSDGWIGDGLPDVADETDKAYEKFYCELTGLEFWYGYYMGEQWWLDKRGESPESKSDDSHDDDW